MYFKTNSLFVKIFLWFWLAMTLTGIVLLAMEASRTRELSRRWRSVTADAFAAYAITAAQAQESEPSGGNNNGKLAEYLKELEERAHIRARLLDEQNREISPSGGAVPLAQPPWMVERIRQLTARANRSGQTEFEPQGNTTLVARLAVTPSGRRYILLGELPVAQYGPWIPNPGVQALRLLAVLVTAGIVCWGLGRHLTAPIVKLRSATRRLADGDLDARASPGLEGRGDELAALARDFDGMAGRIQSLLSEKERLLNDQRAMMAAQRRLLGDVSHELRSPLARVTVALEMARDRADSLPHRNDPKVPGRRSTLHDAHNRIERETEHLNTLINRLLTLSRLESGVQPPSATPVDLAELVRVVVADAEFEANPQRRVVELIDCEDCIISGSADLLHSAVENVVRNAVRHTPEGTSVEVTLRQDQLESNGDDEQRRSDRNDATRCDAVITVRDHGPGVPESELNNVLKPFYRVAETNVRHHNAADNSAGLGLAITARAVEIHGGRIEASNAPGGGLRVEIRVPLIKAKR